MASNLTIEVCPETGICSIVRADAAKIDLMPDEVADIRENGSDPQQVRAVIEATDHAFAVSLSADDYAHIGKRLA